MSFNSREYEWADITLHIGGNDIVGVRAVKYKKKVEREAIYGKGRDPIAIQTGNASYEVEFEVTQSAFLALQAAAGGDITDANVDATVSFGNPNSATPMITDRILGIRFNETETAAKQGDKFMPHTLPGMATGIQKNV